MARLTTFPLSFSPGEGDGYDDPVSYILNFLEGLPDRLELLIDDYSSNLYEWSYQNDVAEFFKPDLIKQSFEAARERLLYNIANRRYQYLDNELRKEADYNYLDLTGFTETSLQLKMNALDYRWSQVLRVSAFNFNFKDRLLIRPLKKLLTYLNSILGSLTGLMPGVDIIKEFKELIENHPALDE